MIVPLPTPLLDVLITLQPRDGGGAAPGRGVVGAHARALDVSHAPAAHDAVPAGAQRLVGAADPCCRPNAGRVIHAFGAFVVRGNYVVGFAVFLILTIVQYIVISRGAERVAEVAARFTLDAMPGKQLAIDADLRAGAIDAERGARGGARACRRRRSSTARWTAPCGSSRATPSPACSILAISLVGRPRDRRRRSAGMPARRRGAHLHAAHHRRRAGLAAPGAAHLDRGGPGGHARAPATRTAPRSGADLARQLLRPRRARWRPRVLLALLALVPGLPLWPFALVGAGAGGAGVVCAPAPPGSAPARAGVRGALAAAAARGGARSAARRRRRRRSTTRLVAVTRALADELGVIVPPLQLTIDAGCRCAATRSACAALRWAAASSPTGACSSTCAPRRCRRASTGRPPSTRPRARWRRGCRRRRGAAAGGRRSSCSTAPPAWRRASTARCARTRPSWSASTRPSACSTRVARAYPALVREVVPRRVDTATLVAEVLRRLVAEGVGLRDLPTCWRRWPAPPSGARPRRRSPSGCARSSSAQITHRSRRAASDVEALLLDSDAEEAVRGAHPPDARTARSWRSSRSWPTRSSQSVDREAGAHKSRGDRHLRRAAPPRAPAGRGRAPAPAGARLPGALPDVQVERVGTIRITE